MTTEKIDTLVVGAGQAGVAMSEHLTKLGVPHLVLERDLLTDKLVSLLLDLISRLLKGLS